jgi:hypothetical protein
VLQRPWRAGALVPEHGRLRLWTDGAEIPDFDTAST